jgi:hypothetical protein
MTTTLTFEKAGMWNNTNDLVKAGGYKDKLITLQYYVLGATTEHLWGLNWNHAIFQNIWY